MKTQPKKMYLRFSRKVRVVHDIYRCYFSVPTDFDFVAGQYIQMTLPHTNADERGTSRFFTITSSPTEKEYLFITTRRGKSSFKKMLFSLAPGAEVQFFGPIGTFVLSV